MGHKGNSFLSKVYVGKHVTILLYIVLHKQTGSEYHQAIKADLNFKKAVFLSLPNIGV